MKRSKLSWNNGRFKLGRSAEVLISYCAVVIAVHFEARNKILIIILRIGDLWPSAKRLKRRRVNGQCLLRIVNWPYRFFFYIKFLSGFKKYFIRYVKRKKLSLREELKPRPLIKCSCAYSPQRNLWWVGLLQSQVICTLTNNYID